MVVVVVTSIYKLEVKKMPLPQRGDSKQSLGWKQMGVDAQTCSHRCEGLSLRRG
jgi:hypothetical protein